MAPAKKTQGTPQAKSMPKAGKDPKGGLTAAGRAYFKQKEGANLRPGVRGAADTPEKLVRKGSFLRRHYANPPGPVVDAQGRPTRQALQAAAWGEPVPKNEADERKLAAKGKQLLDRYHQAKGDARGGSTGGSAKKTSSSKPRNSRSAASSTPARKAPAAKSTTRKVSAAKRPAARSGATKVAVKGSPAQRRQAAKAISKRARG